LRLFRSHVRRRAHDRSGLCQAVAALGAFGQAEVGNFHGSVGGNEHVARLDVAMDDASVMCRLHGAGNLLDDSRCLARLERRAIESSLQGPAGAELGRQIRCSLTGAQLEDLNHARMLNGSDCLGFHHEPAVFLGTRQIARQDPLQSDQAIERDLSRLVDDAHGPAADLLQHLVPGHLRQR
jgi:hypothetical protein